MNTLVLNITEDANIIQELLQGNSEIAATTFVRKYQKFVYTTCLRYLQDYDEADDASQEIFIKALRNMNSFRGQSSLKTWIYKISVNYCLSYLRKKSIKRIFQRYDSSNEEFLEIADNNSPDKQLEFSEFNTRFLNALTKLPEKQRETFALRYFDDLTYEEISAMVGTTIGGLKANYFQAIKKLNEILRPEDK
jgi:RNA polymerase sigma-70 factor (ECF subfamily)